MAKRLPGVWRPGFSYKDGKLYRFELRRIVVLAPWPDPRAWYRTPARNWQPTRRHADGVLCDLSLALPSTPPGPDRPASDQQIAAGYVAAIPEAVRHELVTLRERRWQVMNLCARVPNGLELYRCNPGLAFCLANNWGFHRPVVAQPYRAARSLVRRKQREIARWLGFPATDAAVRILAKIEPPALTVKAMVFLRQALADVQLARVLGHLEVVNDDVLQMVSRKWLRPRLTPQLLVEASCDAAREITRGASAVRMLEDTLVLAQRLAGHEVPRQFTRLVQLRDVHDRLALIYNEEVAELDLRRYDGVTLPPPPFLGTADIVPLESAASVIHEGLAMNHCVGTYVDRVLNGSVFLYRVPRPVPATLAITRGLDGRWGPGELRGPRNAPIEEGLATCLFRDLFDSPTTDRVSGSA